MKIKGQPQHYWIIQRRVKEDKSLSKVAGSWGITHKNKVYWNYEIAKGAIIEFEKLKQKWEWFDKNIEYRIVRLEVIGVEEVLSNFDSDPVGDLKKEKKWNKTRNSQQSQEPIYLRVFKRVKRFIQESNTRSNIQAK